MRRPFKIRLGFLNFSIGLPELGWKGAASDYVQVLGDDFYACSSEVVVRLRPIQIILTPKSLAQVKVLCSFKILIPGLQVYLRLLQHGFGDSEFLRGRLLRKTCQTGFGHFERCSCPFEPLLCRNDIGSEISIVE